MKTIQLRKNNQITLPDEAIPEGTTLFTYEKLKDGNVLLKPLKTVPAYEAWLYEDPKLIASLDQGIRDAAKGKVKYLGSFAKYAKLK